jgi:hyperosmotically inducible protein
MHPIPWPEKIVLGVLVALLFLSILMFFSACADCNGEAGPTADDEANASSEGEGIDDDSIRSAVQDQYFHDGLIPPTRAKVDVQYGIATISGTVDSVPVRDRAVALAGSVRGVRAVVDQLEVLPMARDDEEIVDEIERVLEVDCVLDPSRMDVGLTGGEARISGSVDSWSERFLAGRVVGSVRGVGSVNNALRVTREVEVTDDDIRSTIEKRLRLDPFVDARLVEVEVSGGSVLLRGTLASVEQVARAGRLAHVPGVLFVSTIPLVVDAAAERAPGTAGGPPPGSADEVVLSLLQAMNRDARIPASTVNATMHEGTVTLSGRVECLRARLAAGASALQATGVRSVENRIVVLPAAKVKDAKLRQDVETMLDADALLCGQEIASPVSGGTVTLTGTVDSMQHRLRATDVAARVRGVVAISNELQLASEGPWKNDPEIETEIREELFWNTFVDGGAVDVSVVSSVAILSGALQSWQEVRAAAREAFDAGASGVESNIEVAGQPRPALILDSRDLEAWRLLTWPPPSP